jgi:prepilin-type N-terminal cleavage/methylation domain-containing protein
MKEMDSLLAKLRARRQEEEGFTLIELLIVIIILGILAAIVIFALTGLTNKGNNAACETTVKTIDTAAAAYYAQHGSGAGTIGDLVAANLLSSDSNFSSTSGTSVTIKPTGGSQYTIVFTPGDSTTPGNADTTTCPANGT